MNGQLNTNTDQVKGLSSFLNRGMPSLQAVASQIITPERMVRLVCAAASKDKKLLDCTHLSILRSMMQSAELGLEVCSGKNEGYLVPRWNSKAKALECTFLPGYQGLIKLAVESGKVRNIESRVVYEADTFQPEYGTHPKIVHVPSFKKDRGAIVAVYAVAFLPDGQEQFEIMALHEIEEIRDRNKDEKGDKFSPWKSDFSEMARKTSVRRLSKYLPKTPAFAAALEIQAKAESGDVFEVEVLRPSDPVAPEDIWHTTWTTPEGETIKEWSDHAKQQFDCALGDLEEACISAGLNATETEKKMAHYQDQRCIEDPQKVLDRIVINIQSVGNKKAVHV